MKPGALLVGSAVGAGSWWTVRHRTAPAVAKWRQSALPGRRVGALHLRYGGSTDSGPVVVLMHGLVATGDIFGAAFDPLAETATLVVPDLLGFGRSLDESRSSYDPDDHLGALDDMLAGLGLDGRPIVIGAHSMGGAVAIRWAQRLGDQVQRVVCWGPPIYPGSEAVGTALADEGAMARLFVANTAWARAACRINCTHRTLAGLAAAAASPSVPVPIARAASLHTWPAYRDAMKHLVAGTDWPALVRAAAGAGTIVELTWGSDDRIGHRPYARTFTGSSIEIVPGAAHHLPMTHGERCRIQLRA